MRRERSRNRGVSLLEVAVTLLVLGIGLLGLVRLHGLARQQLFDAAQRTTATSIARDVMTGIGENRAALPGYQALGSIVHSPGAEPAVDCTVQDCSNTERVVFDAYQWGRKLGGGAGAGSGAVAMRADGGLVNGQICISHEAGLVGVEVSWRASTQGGVPAAGAMDCGVSAESSGDSDGQRRAVRMVSHVGLP